MNEMQETIYDSHGNKYITMIYDSNLGIIKMRIHRYDPEVIYVNFDQKAVPKMIDFFELVRSK